MSWIAIAVGAAGAASGIASANSAKDAAGKQADAIAKAGEISAGAADQARLDILETYGPALADFTGGIALAKNEILSGQTTVANIFAEATRVSSQQIQQGTEAAQRAILGLPPTAVSGVSGSVNIRPPGGTATTGTPTAPRVEVIPPGTGAFAGLDITNIPDVTPASGTTDLAPEDVPANLLGIAQAGEISQNIRQNVSRKGVLNVDNTAQLFSSDPGSPAVPQVSSELANVVASGTSDRIIRPGSPSSIEAGVSGISAVESAVPIGLAGSEAVTREGGEFALGTLQAGGRTARGDIAGGGAESRTAVREGAEGALVALANRTSMARADLTGAQDTSLAGFDPFASTGTSAQLREAALSGALGPEAEAQAQAEFSESPGQRFRREQQEKALVRNQAAIGGLGGGRVRTALQEQAAGIASTNQQQFLENLRSLAIRGQGAVGSQAGIRANTSTQLAGLETGQAGAEAQVQQTLGQNLANIATAEGTNLASTAQSTATNESAVIAQLTRDLAAARTRAGEQIATTTAAGAGAQADLVTQLGANLAGGAETATTNLANLAVKEGAGAADLKVGLGTTLGNIAVGQGTTQATLAKDLGDVKAAGELGKTAGNVSAGSQFAKALAEIIARNEKR